MVRTLTIPETSRDGNLTPIVLVIDDDPLLGPIVRHALRLPEVRAILPDAVVMSAPNGLRGAELGLAHTNRIRLAIVDLKMPVLDGRHFGAWLRDKMPNVPILPCTGDKTKVALWSDLGCAAPLLKGFEFEDLAQRLIDVLTSPPTQTVATDVNSAFAEQTEVLLSFVRGGGGEQQKKTVPPVNDAVVLPRPVIEKLNAQLTDHARRLRSRSRELSQVINTLDQALIS